MALAYEKNVSLAFDTAVLRNCGERYGRVAADLRRMSRDLDQCINELKEDGWTTPAGSVFYEMTKTNWAENIEKYAALLDTLKQILRSSADKYEELLEDHIRNTKVNL